MKIKVPKKCTICQARGIKSPHGHRNSSKCPFYKKYCSICLKIGEVTNLHDTDKCPNNSTTTLDENEKLANSVKNSHSNFFNTLFNIFKVINMKPNGHCGFNAIMKVIPLKYGSFHNVVEFRKSIYHSFDKFKSNCFKLMSFKSVNKKILFENKIKQRIYIENMSESTCAYGKWLQDYTVVPIIACMFPDTKFMIYCPNNNQTSVWIKESKKDIVTHHFGKYVITPEKECACVVYDGTSHYDALIIV